MPMWHALSIILSIKNDGDIPKIAIAKAGEVRSNINWRSQPIILESAWHKLEGNSLAGRQPLLLPTPAVWRTICCNRPQIFS